MAGTSVHAHSQEAATTLDAVVVGTGFAGLYMAGRHALGEPGGS